jgi:hypothetical protein
VRRAKILAPLVPLGPIALVATGCSLRPWTPSTDVAYWAEETPDVHSMTVPAMGDAIGRWQLPPTNPWARYEKYTLLTALDSKPGSVELPDVWKLDVADRATRAADHTADAGLPNDTMWVVDMRGAASVIFGAELSRRASEPVSLVLTFNNWPAENELVPAEETLAALVSTQPKLPEASDHGTRPVFLLDSWRLAYRDDEVDDDTTDNRYLLGPTDLPTPSELRAAGIRKVVYVVESLDDTTVEEDDLHTTFQAYQAAGIGLFMVDLAVLSQDEVAPERWDAVLEPRGLWIEDRYTVVEDLEFYGRARGGFGGVRGGPPPIRGGTSWYGTGAGG